MKNVRFSGLKGCATIALLATLVAASRVDAQSQDIVDTAVSAGSFKTLAQALQAAGLVEALKQDGPFTVFAPTDDAFAQLPKGTLAKLLKPENRQTLTAILTYHVVPGRVPASAVVTMSNAQTLNGQRVDITASGKGVMIDNASVIKTDIGCSNGIIHVIDQVIMPSTDDILATARSAGKFKTLAAAIKAAGLNQALSGSGPFTVFAPTDSAFEKLPRGTVESLLKPENRDQLASILKYHVISGRVFSNEAVAAQSAMTLEGQEVRVRVADGRLKVNDATVVMNDLDAANGVIHVIDTVLLPQMPQKKISALGTSELIELAIERGAPLFNRGQVKACAAIYEVTAQSLLNNPSAGLSPSVRQELTSALMQIKSEHDSTKQAWTLRHALDEAYTADRQAAAQH